MVATVFNHGAGEVERHTRRAPGGASAPEEAGLRHAEGGGRACPLGERPGAAREQEPAAGAVVQARRGALPAGGGGQKRRALDPRFEAQSGRLNEDLFNKSYAFLDDYKQRELQELKQQLKKTKSVTKKDELKVSQYP